MKLCCATWEHKICWFGILINLGCGAGAFLLKIWSQVIIVHAQRGIYHYPSQNTRDINPDQNTWEESVTIIFFGSLVTKLSYFYAVKMAGVDEECWILQQQGGGGRNRSFSISNISQFSSNLVPPEKVQLPILFELSMRAEPLFLKM